MCRCQRVRDVGLGDVVEHPDGCGARMLQAGMLRARGSVFASVVWFP